MYGADVPKYVTRRDALRPEHSFQLIWPYTDLLLHDMGPLGDGIVQGDARGTEMRTPVLAKTAVTGRSEKERPPGRSSDSSPLSGTQTLSVQASQRADARIRDRHPLQRRGAVAGLGQVGRRVAGRPNGSAGGRVRQGQPLQLRQPQRQ